MGFAALGKYVLVKPEEKKDKTDGGILLPDNVRVESPMKGVLVSTHSDHLAPYVGKTVYFDSYGIFAVGDLVAVQEEFLVAVED